MQCQTCDEVQTVGKESNNLNYQEKAEEDFPFYHYKALH